VRSEHIAKTIESQEHGMALITPAISTRSYAVEQMTFQINVDPALLLQIDSLPNAVALKVVLLFRSIEDFDDYIVKLLPDSRSLDGKLRAAFIAEMDQKFSTLGPLARELGDFLNEIIGPALVSKRSAD
jgi:hypothetical protein